MILVIVLRRQLLLYFQFLHPKSGPFFVLSPLLSHQNLLLLLLLPLSFNLPLLVLLVHLLLLLLFLLLLCLLELLEDIDVVQQSVRKLLLEVLVLQVALNAGLNQRIFEKIRDGGSSPWVSYQDWSYKCRYFLAEAAREPVKSSLYNSLCELMQTPGVERRAESTHLVKQHSKRPHVRLEIVGLIFDDFW